MCLRNYSLKVSNRESVAWRYTEDDFESLRDKSNLVVNQLETLLLKILTIIR